VSAGTTAAVTAMLLVACTLAETRRSWRPLFDGSSMLGLYVTSFGGEGSVAVVDGQLVLEPGSPLTGVHLDQPLPASGYELEVTAARLDGHDFFCGLTFPVGREHLTLVLGGWGGTVCGISSLDGEDAAHNETRRLRHFETGRFYRVSLQVRPRTVQVAIDGEPFLAVALAARALSLRAEMEPCRPLGLACFQSRAAVRSLRWRPL